MKIAICISGQPRSYEAGFYELKKWFLDRYDCDVYIHTWEDTNTIFTSSHNFTETRHYQFTKEDYQKILDLYQPKAYIFQKPIKFEDKGIIGNLGFTLDGLLSSWLSIQSCFNLVEESDIKYDLVIKTRFDLQFTNYISPECEFLKDITQLDPNYFHCFSYNLEGDGNFRPVEIDDLFNVGSFDIMKIHSQLFSYLLHYIYNSPEHINWLVTHIGDPDPFSHESLLKWHIIQNNIPIKRVHSLGSKFTAGIIR
jgi:hypothetical protein